MTIDTKYPDYLKVALEKEGEFVLLDKQTGKRLEVFVLSQQNEKIFRDSVKCKEVGDEVFHYIKRRGELSWVIEGQVVR
jgi:hypothetical protein